MTKVQMKAAALELCKNNKASKALTTALEELFNEYAASAKGTADKIAKHIEVDGVHYRWCNRHEVYEPATNFNAKNPRDCRLAYKHWQFLGNDVKAKNDKFMAAALEGEDVQELAAELKAAKELRAGRYNLADNALQHADIEDYDYNATTFTEMPSNAKILDEA